MCIGRRVEGCRVVIEGCRVVIIGGGPVPVLSFIGCVSELEQFMLGGGCLASRQDENDK